MKGEKRRGRDEGRRGETGGRQRWGEEGEDRITSSLLID